MTEIPMDEKCQATIETSWAPDGKKLRCQKLPGHSGKHEARAGFIDFGWDGDSTPLGTKQHVTVIDVPAAGCWVAVADREPKPGQVVLGRWKNGAVRVIDWTEKKREGTPDGCIWFAHATNFSCGLREWPTHWAEILP